MLLVLHQLFWGATPPAPTQRGTGGQARFTIGSLLMAN